ncbi:type II toxin-antitoxin system VapC family toxin [Candidatus Gottesmanbacteria bacterium]|nr:type II toxin-antitoxin system VapC family toxin [Candidatus Gottesmanbacteria bacterium]
MNDRQKIFVDSSAWIALSSEDDKNYRRITDFFSKIISDGAVFFTSNDVIDETVTRLVYDIGFRQTQKFIEEIKANVRKKSLVQFWTDEQIQEEAFAILKKYHDHKLSMTDATTVAIMKRFRLDAVLTLDSDFKKIGLPSVP